MAVLVVAVAILVPPDVSLVQGNVVPQCVVALMSLHYLVPSVVVVCIHHANDELIRNFCCTSLSSVAAALDAHPHHRVCVAPISDLFPLDDHQTPIAHSGISTGISAEFATAIKDRYKVDPTPSAIP